MLVDAMTILGSTVLASASRSYYTSGIPMVGHSRGEHVLHVYSSGSIRCISCFLCGVVCPAYAISIVVGYTVASIRVPIHYGMCYNRCIFCGWCDVVCPTGSISEVRVLLNTTCTQHTLYMHTDTLLYGHTRTC
nr:NADH dehydrogenase subunit 8 [Artemidia motanka]